MTKRTKILIADDHAVFRHGLKDLVLKHFPGALVGMAETGQGALEQVRQGIWHIVVLDVTMPGRSGIDILPEIRQIQPTARILMLSMHPEEQYAPRLLKAGAAGYINKIKAPVEILEAIKQVLSGGKYLSPALADRLAGQAKSGAEKPAHESLSRREYQVMCLLPTGKSLKAIAGELAVSCQTVSTHRTRILRKMDVTTTAELIRYALKNGLVD